MRVNFADTKSQLDKLDREAEQVVEKYDSAKWEDEVKASHSSFVSQCKEIKSDINSIKSSLDGVEQLAGSVEESSNVTSNLRLIRLSFEEVSNGYRKS